MPVASTENDDDSGSFIRTQSNQSALVPAPASNFRGSFAPRGRCPSPYIRREAGIQNLIWIYFTSGWSHVPIWKSAFIEMVASMSLCYLSALIDITIANLQTPQIPAYVGMTNIFLLSLFIYACSPASGGHINPTITFATMTTGLIEFPRAVLYVCGQTIGAAVAGGLIRGSFGLILTKKYYGGGCFRNTDDISPGQAFLIEAISSFILLFLAFGVGLDPRQAELFGPRLGPLFVGCSLGIVSFASSGLAPGYTGASMNPARCFAFATARADYKDQWIWWIGPLAGIILMTICYDTVPPYHSRPVPIHESDHEDESTK